MASTSDSTAFWQVIVPSDTVDLPNGPSNYIYVGVTGNVTAVCNGATILFSNLAVGYHPIRTTRVKATGTTATNMLQAN